MQILEKETSNSDGTRMSAIGMGKGSRNGNLALPSDTFGPARDPFRSTRHNLNASDVLEVHTAM